MNREAGGILTNILKDRSPHITDEEFAQLKTGVGQSLAHICDYLIMPAARDFPDLNQYPFDRSDTT